MDKDKTTISFLDFAKDVHARYDNEEVIGWLGQEITIKRRLALYEVINFVADVIDNCYQGEDVLTFMPELMDYAIKFCMISYYTNISLLEETTEADVKDESVDTSFHPDDFITKSDIIDVIKNHVDMEQFYFINEAIKSKIEYINQTNVAGVMSDISKVNGVIGDVMPALEELSSDENKKKFDELVNILTMMSQDNALQQLAIQQVKNERQS